MLPSGLHQQHLTIAVEVADDPERPGIGRALRATRAVRAGSVLIRERYLTFVSLQDDLGCGARHRALYEAVVHCAHDSKVSSEGDVCGSWGAGIAGIRDYKFEVGDDCLAKQLEAEVRMEGLADVFGQEAIEQSVYLARVFKKNAFAFPGASGRRNELLFPTISRANHSCRPNAVIVPGASDEAMLVAIRPIALGEHAEISYLDSSQLLTSTTLRRAAIEKEWGFCCSCVRCTAAFDETRQFAAACAACNAIGVAVYTGNLCCIACGSAVEDAPLVQRLFGDEAEAELLIARLPSPQDFTLPARDSLVGLQPHARELLALFAGTHPQHFVSAELTRRRVVSLHEHGAHTEAAAAQESFVTAAMRLLDMPDGLRGLPWFVDVLGRLALTLVLAGRRSEARAALCELLANLDLVSGQRIPAGRLRGLLPQSQTWQSLVRQSEAELDERIPEGRVEH